MNQKSNSNIRIGRFNTNNSSSFPKTKQIPNPFDLLIQVSSDDLESPKQTKIYQDIPPINLIDWKKGILNGMSWADAVGA